MKILHLISSGGFYGAENMLANLLPGLGDLGIEVSLCVFDNRSCSQLEIATRAAQAGIDVQVIPCKGRLDLRAVRRLKILLRHSSPDLLHTHGYKADLYGFLATRGTKTPVVATCHNWTLGSPALKVYAFLDKLCLRAFNSVVAVSPQVAAELKRSGVHSDRIRPIRNGVAVPLEEDPSEDPAASPAGCAGLTDDSTQCSQSSRKPGALCVGLASRLVSDKGITDFLYAARHALATYPSTRFLIAGEGADRQLFEREAAALGISHAVTFAGFIADMSGFYKAIDIFILPSLREGLPMCVLEALAAGKGVIATAVGAIPELIQNEQTGMLVLPGDREALSAALERLLQDEPLRWRLGIAAKESIRRSWSAQTMSANYLALYADISGMPEPSSFTRRFSLPFQPTNTEASTDA